jgi:hypothetical protein
MDKGSIFMAEKVFIASIFVNHSPAKDSKLFFLFFKKLSRELRQQFHNERGQCAFPAWL